MDKIRVRRVAPPERRKLHRLKRQLTNQVNGSRARIILLSSGGVANREIAQRVGRSPQWVREIVHRFNRDGLAGIQWYPYWQTFLAAYDLETGRLFGQFTERKTWVEFLTFLKWLRRRYRHSETLHVVLDNYSPHLKQEVRDWAQGHNVKFYFTPSNASWLNRIESQFTALKKFALENSDFRTHEEQEAAIESYLAWRNGRREIANESWRAHIRQQHQCARAPQSDALALSNTKLMNYKRH